MRLLFLLVVLLTLPGFAGDARGQACASRLFVSGYFSTVHVYDACTGAYLRDLDTPTRIRGAQAVRLGPDGLIYVAMENIGKPGRVIRLVPADEVQRESAMLPPPRG